MKHFLVMGMIFVSAQSASAIEMCKPLWGGDIEAVAITKAYGGPSRNNRIDVHLESGQIISFTGVSSDEGAPYSSEVIYLGAGTAGSVVSVHRNAKYSQGGLWDFISLRKADGRISYTALKCD